MSAIVSQLFEAAWNAAACVHGFNVTPDRGNSWLRVIRGSSFRPTGEFIPHSSESDSAIICAKTSDIKRLGVSVGSLLADEDGTSRFRVGSVRRGDAPQVTVLECSIEE